MTGSQIHLITLLHALLLGASTSALAQGALLFANYGAEINYPILVPSGSPAQLSDNVLADLYYGATSVSATNAIGLQVQVGVGGFGIVAPGYFVGPSPGNLSAMPIPGFSWFATVFAKIVTWQGGSTYASATISRGESPVAMVNLTSPTQPFPYLPLGTGTIQLQPVPEPSLLALAVLGGGLILLRYGTGTLTRVHKTCVCSVPVG